MTQPNGHPRKTNRIVNGETPGPVPPGVQQQQPPAGVAPERPGRVQQAQVPPSIESAMAEFEQLIKSNQAKFGELAQQGTAPDPFFLIHARINHLIDSISQFAGPNGPRWAALTRLEFERYIAAELEQAGPASRRLQLAEGARYTPEMISALARQTGTLRRTH